ncbi:MAG: dihydrofolate reductase family protein [Planctomycetota bacterium]
MPQRATTVVYIATSLDGFIARPDGGFDWLTEPPEGEDFGWAEFIATVDAMIMGRVTFETVLQFDGWPYEGTPLTVLSRTLESVPEHLRDGRAEVSSLTPAALLEQMAGRGHKRVYVDGGKTVQSFIELDLIDELIVTRVPVLIGQGLPLFGPLDRDVDWEHVSTKTYAGGLVKTAYRRQRS